jgi:hypothetical protein
MVPLIRADILDDATVTSLRTVFRGSGIPFVNVESAVQAETAAGIRSQVDAAGYETFYIADRGRYQLNDSLDMKPLVSSLLAVASRIVDASLALARTRWFCFRRGDYSLQKDDAQNRLEGTWFELTLDFSERASGQSDITYSDGSTRLLIVPQEPGCLTLIERTPAIYRYIRPMTVHSLADRVHRLQLWLQRE